jgi:AcrR family transcriptional regulator
MKRALTNGLKRPKRGRPPIPGLREKILSSALKLFSEKGFADVLTGDVAAVAGVGKGSIYREFGSKEALYAAAVIEGFQQLRARLEAALREARSNAEMLATIVRQTAEYFWTHGEFFALLRDPTALPPGPLRYFRQQRAKLSNLISETLREGAANGVLRADLDFDLVAEAILGMIRGTRRHHREGVTVDAAVTTIVAVLTHGYLADRGQRRVVREVQLGKNHQ